MGDIAFHQDGERLRISIDGVMATEGQANLVCEDLNSPAVAAVIQEQWQARFDAIAKGLEAARFGDWTTGMK
jgi:hypothetical protein